MMKIILLQLLFLGSIFSQDQFITFINDEYDSFFQETDNLITDFKIKNPNIFNDNVVFENESLKLNFTLINGLVSGPYNISIEREKDVFVTYNVDYLNGIKNGKFLMNLDIGDIKNFFKIEGFFSNNLKNGVFRFWKLGSPSLVISFKNNIPHGPFISFHQNENEYPLYSDKPKMKGIYKNGEIISYEEINKRGRVTYRSGKSRENYNKQMNELQKSLETLGEIFSQ